MNTIALRIVCVLMALGMVAGPAWAEVQNIKVDGQISIRGFWRDNYTTVGSGGGRLVGTEEDDEYSFPGTKSRDWYNSVVELGIKADLTDNVMAKIRLLNERDWQVEEDEDMGFGVGVETAAIILKEVLYSPLTVKAGRMPLQLADGLVIGDGVTDETLLASDYSVRRSFDTIHGILDYDPLTLIFGTMKYADRASEAGDDIDGYMIDAVYKFGDGKTVMDTYLLAIHFNSPGIGFTGLNDASDRGLDVYTFASRLMTEFMDGIMLDASLGIQFGDYENISGDSRDLRAAAANFGMHYVFDSEFAPKIGVKYLYRSGNNSDTGTYKGWLPLFTSQANGIIYNPLTNTNSLGISGSMMPLDRLTLGADFWWYRLVKRQADGTHTSTKKSAGTEVDVMCKYAYTEDVSMGLSVAYFLPGEYYKSGRDKTAKQVMLEMGVRF